MICISITSPFPAIQAGLRSLIQMDPELQVSAEFSTPSEWNGEYRPADVYVITSAGPISEQWLKQIRNTLPSRALLILTSDSSFSAELHPHRWGVIPFSASAETLSTAIHALANGLFIFGEGLLPGQDSGQKSLHFPSAPGQIEALTRREMDVLQCLAQGLTNKIIAATLKISTHTVKYHISSIYSKLGASNRTEAVRIGLRQGFINL